MKAKANLDIRKMISEAGLCHWHVAAKVPMIDVNFSRMLRFELNDEQRDKVLTAIEKAKRVFVAAQGTRV